MSKITPWWKQKIPTHQKSHHEWGKNWCFFPKVLLMFLAPSEICLPSFGQLELQGPKCPRRIRGVLGEVIHALRGSHQGHLKVTAKIIHPMVVFWCTQFLQQHLHLYGIIWDYIWISHIFVLPNFWDTDQILHKPDDCAILGCGPFCCAVETRHVVHDCWGEAKQNGHLRNSPKMG